MGRGAGTDDLVGPPLPLGELDGPPLPLGEIDAPGPPEVPGLCDPTGANVGSGDGVGAGVGLGVGRGVELAAASNGIPLREAFEAPRPPRARVSDRAAAARTAKLTLRVPFRPQVRTSLSRQPGPAGDSGAVVASSGGGAGGAVVAGRSSAAAAAREVRFFGLDGALAVAVAGAVASAATGAATSAATGGRARDQRGRSPAAALTASDGVSRPTSSSRP